MSKVIIRHTEIPKEWTQKRLKTLYPDAAVVGDNYGYWHHVKQTNVVFVSMDWRGLVKAVVAHLKGNELPVPADINFEMMVEYCYNTGSPNCAEEDGNEGERQHYMTMASRFLRAMEDAVVNGLVDQTEAERRAEICSKCPKNTDEKFRWCMGCSAQTAAAKVARFTLGRSTSYDDRLKNCSVCHCVNNLKVHVRREAMDYPELRDKWWSDCWMRLEN